MRKFILCLLILFAFNKAQTQNITDIKVDMFAYNNATIACEYLIRYYKLKINYDATRLKNYDLEADWKQEPLVNVLKYICKKSKSKYFVTDSMTINIVVENEFIPNNSAITPQNTFTGKPVKSNITITGRLKDRQTGEAIPYATLYIRGTTNGTTTNADGYFTLNKVPSDTCCIIAKNMGYLTNYYFLNPSMKILNIILEMQYSAITLSTVTVTADLENLMQEKKEDISIIKMSPRKVEELPNVGEKDIMRAFQLMPGVSAANESSSNLYVRGGTPDQNLVLYDGFTVYQVDHLYGFYSAFNANALKDVQLYKGGFESKFGGRLSSVTEITGKDGDQNKFNLGGDLSLLSANIFTEFPVGEKITFVAAARKSYQGLLYDWIFNKFQTGKKTAPVTQMPGGGSSATSATSYFYDLNSKLTFRPTKKDIIFLSFFNGNDMLDNGFDMSSSNSNMPSGGMNINSSNTDITSYGNTGASLKWSRIWSEKLYGSTLLSFSNYYSNRDKSTNATFTNTTGTENSMKQGLIEKNNLKDFSFKSDYEWSVFHNHKIGFGAFATYYNISYKFSESDTASIIDKHNYSILAGGYLQDKMNFLKSKLIVTPGLRYSYFDATKKLYLEPRFASTYSVTNKLTSKVAIGQYYQFANRVTREDILSGSRDFWILSNNSNIPVSSAIHYITGFSYETKKYLFSIEGYYKTLTNLSEYSLRFEMGGPQKNITYSENFFNGSGIAKGIEFLLQKKFGKFNGWVSYTLGEVQNQFSVYSDSYYPASQDATHEFKIVLLYKWKRFDFSATWIYATGKPYTAPSGAYTVTLLDGTTQDYFTTTSKNSLRLPDYHRLDLAVNYHFNNSNGDDIGYIGFSLFNAYNRTNVWYKEYQIISHQILETNVNYFGITPNITLSLRIR